MTILDMLKTFSNLNRTKILFLFALLISLCSLLSPSALANIDAEFAKSVANSGVITEFKHAFMDSSGNTYAVGYIGGTGTHDFGNGVTVSGSHTSENAVLVKYDSNGDAQWAKSTVSGSNNSNFKYVFVDGSGNIYASGSIVGSGTFDFGNGVTVSGGASGYDNAFFVKYNSSGDAQFAKSTVSGSANNRTYFNAIVVDGSGNIYAGGSIKGEVTHDFGNGATAVSDTRWDALVLVKYNSSGTVQWAKTANNGDESKTTAINGMAMCGGAICAAGSMGGQSTITWDFGNGVTLSGVDNDYNTLLIKYDVAGQPQWAKTVVSQGGGGSNGSWFDDIVSDSSGNVYAVGLMYSTDNFNFGNGVEVTGVSSGQNALIMKYNSSTGTPLWASSTETGLAGTGFSSVGIDSDLNLYAAGFISDTLTAGFGNGVSVTGSHAADYNALLVKYDNSGVAQNARTVESGATDASSFLGVDVDNAYISAVGYIKNTGTYDFGDGVTTSGDNSSENLVFVSYVSNNPPEIVNNDFDITEGATQTITTTMLSGTDGELDDSQLVFNVQSVTNGEFQKDDGGWSTATTFTQQDVIDSKVRFVHNGDSDAPTFEVQVDDGDKTSSWVAGVVDFTPVNDKPVISGIGTLDYTEGQGAITIDPSITISDEDDANLQGATIQITGNYQSTEDRLAFVNQLGIVGSWEEGTGMLELLGDTTLANYKAATQTITYENISANPNTGPRTLTWILDDGTDNSDPIQTTINVNASDGSPVINNNNFAITEGATQQITNTMLSASDEETAAGLLELSVRNVTYGEFQKYDGGWSAATTFTQQDVIDGDVRFVHNGDSAAPTFQVQVSDGSLTSSWIDGNVAFTAVNDKPILSGIGTLTYNEGQGVVVIDPSVTINDEDDANLNSAIIQITGGYQSSEDRLAFVNQLGIVGSWEEGTGTLELIGDTTVVNYKAALQQVTYENISSSATGGDRTLTWTLNDGTDDSDPVNSTIEVQTTNSPPEIVNTSFAITEGATQVLNNVMLSATDAETAAGELSFVLRDVAHGGFQKDVGIGDWQPASIFTQQDITDGKVRFVHNGDSAAPTFDVQVNDGSQSSDWLEVDGGPYFTPVNDAPKVNKEIEEQIAFVGKEWKFSVPSDTFTDEDDSDDDLLYRAYILVNDSETSLPSWLDFSEGDRKFTGNPDDDLDGEELVLVVEAEDLGGKTAKTNFTLKIEKEGLWPRIKDEVIIGTIATGTIAFVAYVWNRYFGGDGAAAAVVDSAIELVNTGDPEAGDATSGGGNPNA